MSSKSQKSDHQVFSVVRNFLTSYISFPRPEYADICTLWALGTHVFESFDSYGYMVITASTKRAGKTVLAELMAMCSKDAENGTSMTASILRRLVSKGSTIFFDEAEGLNSESASTIREYLNVGYRSGSFVYMPGAGPDEVIKYAAYSPKTFILIGDVNDTLRDRSIVIELARAKAPKKYFRSAAEREAKDLMKGIPEFLASDVTTQLADADEDVINDALEGREAEVWNAVIYLAQILAPSKVDGIIRTAVDLSALKQTTEKKRFSEIRKDAEQASNDTTFSERAISDLVNVVDGQRAIFTETAIAKMKDISAGPWRMYKGEGLTPMSLADLVSVFGVQPKLVKIAGKTKRGFQRADILAGAKKLGAK